MELSYSKHGSGPVIIILHGLYGSGDNWFNIARELANNFTVYLIDQRNHGKSPHSPTLAYDVMAQDLFEFVTQHELDSVNIIGHSMGGKTAITYTLLHGEKVKKLINVDISPYSYEGITSFREQYIYHKSIIERFQTAPIDKTNSRAEIEAYFAEKITNTSTRRFLLKNLSRNSTGEFQWKLNIDSISSNIDKVIDAAPPVKMGAQSFVDTLFIRGEKSPYITNEDMEGIKDIFPNSSFISYENSGHWLHVEETERFVNDVMKFLL